MSTFLARYLLSSSSSADARFDIFTVKHLEINFDRSLEYVLGMFSYFPFHTVLYKEGMESPLKGCSKVASS
jgi:hypothetical protein